jgi:DNA-binding CsgD family transcriptional regulator
MAALSARGRRALEHLRLVAADASDARLLADRALAILDTVVPFDDGALFEVDDGSLLFTRVLGYRGPAPDDLRTWLRDVYLVAREPPSLHFPSLLRAGGGAGVYHEDGERWLRATPPPVSATALRAAWRQWDSPCGGALRYGLAHRRRWVGAFQLARLDPGRGFRPAELEFLDRAAPTLARALAERLTPPPFAPEERPGGGQLTFDEHRRLVSVSVSAERWLARLPPDPVSPPVPVAAQSLIGHLAGSGLPTGTLTARDVDGGRVTLSAEAAVRVDSSGAPGRGWAVSIGAAPPGPGAAGLTGAQWAVARAVAAGDSDREIGAALHLSVATVHEHVAALHALLGTGTRPRLVAVLAGGLGSHARIAPIGR